MAERGNAKLLERLVRQAREDRLVYLIFAECRLVFPETATSIARAHHDLAAEHFVTGHRVSQTAARRHDGAGSFRRSTLSRFPQPDYGRSLFNFQGPDFVRGLFYFADGRRIGAEGLRQLKYHVAGLADGHDWDGAAKPSRLLLEEREAWCDSNMARISALRGGGLPSR